MTHDHDHYDRLAGRVLAIATAAPHDRAAMRRALAEEIERICEVAVERDRLARQSIHDDSTVTP